MSGNGNKQPTSSTNQSSYPRYHSNGWVDLDPTMSILNEETWRNRPPPPPQPTPPPQAQSNGIHYFSLPVRQSEMRRY
ncbi:hypothetical protein CRE_24819 [Caenorhabditis remanei]|uniref:Uncharacterized protein n=1 Tax=Caenorhabditis remanei TaxID=31234 RepID=E3NHN9_CAERE|nr:hypothetical protein CRE_24819 [Caenorhabditis remanei]